MPQMCHTVIHLSTTDYDDNDFLHHTNIDDTLNDINNDYSQEHNAIEDSIPDITE